MVLAAGSAVVLFAVARRKGTRVKVRLKTGTVASLAVALVFGLWSGLGAVAGKGDRGVLATNIPAAERAQAAVLPIRERPDAQPVVQQSEQPRPPVTSAALPVLETEDSHVPPPATEARTVKGWADLMDSPEQVQAHWRHGTYHGYFLYDAVTRTMKIETWHWKYGSYQKGDGDGGSTKVETSRYDPKARTLTLAGDLGMGEFRHKGRWTEFEFEVESDAAWDGQFDLVVNRVGLPIGQALLGAKGVRLVTVRSDEAGHLLTVVIDGKEVCRATVTAASWRNHSYVGVELGKGFTCGFRLGRGTRGRGGKRVRLREARLLVTEP